MIHRSPTGSYNLLLPEEVREDTDARAVSYWIPSSSILLQLSSYSREGLLQVSAEERLRDRLSADQPRSLTAITIDIPGCPNVSACAGLDDHDTWWLYVYAVWSDFAVFATISGPDVESCLTSWALRSLQTLQRATSPVAGNPGSKG